MFPDEVGRNWTVITSVLVFGIVNGNAVRLVNCVSDDQILVMVTAAPVWLRTVACNRLKFWRSTTPKFRPSVSTRMVPKPVMLTLDGDSETSLLVMDRVPGWLPPEVGVKVTLKIPVAPAATVSDVILGTNCVSSETIFVILSAEPPVLDTVTVSTEATLTGMLPKAMVPGGTPITAAVVMLIAAVSVAVE